MKIIIASADVSKLLAHADAVLDKYGDRHTVPEKIRGQATLSSMKDFLSMDGYRSSFSSCKIRELAKLNDVNISSEHWDLFSTLHCVDWKDIHPDTREYVTALLFDYFRGDIVMAHAEGTSESVD